MSPVQVAQALPARLPRWYGRWFVFCLGRLLSMQSACVHAVHDVMLRVWGSPSSRCQVYIQAHRQYRIDMKLFYLEAPTTLHV